MKHKKEYYLYQCANCATTLYGDSLPKKESYTYVVNGEICNSCSKEQEMIEDSYYDDD